MEATYFDGESSAPHKISLQVKNGRFIITPFLSLEMNETYSFSISDWKRVDYNSTSSYILETNDFPPKKIILNKEVDILKIQNHYPLLNTGDIHQKILSQNIQKIILASLGCILSTIAIYLFLVSPFISKQVVKMITIDTEITMGNHLSENLINTLDIHSEKSKILMEFYKTCGFKSNYPIDISYVSESTVNAFAIPGGKIVIYSGIINKMDNYEELAGLIGHELAHVEKRHSLLQISNKLSTYLLFSALTSDVGGITTTLLEHSINFKEMKNSRNFEKEADLWGLGQLRNLNIDQQGMVSLFDKILDNESSTLSKTLEYISSHPLTEERIKYLQENSTANNTSKNPKLISLFKKLKKN